ncbi:MAG TPA: hypothetical protein VMU71_04030, partial [Terracidiphilus sp.]|nr:hypothetical protein [Terracidiphilus sp.]
MKLARAHVALVVGLAVCTLPILYSQEKPEGRKDGEAKVLNAAPPGDSTTEGSVTVGGQAIAYQAVAGTLTVGSTDVQDAMIGLDGKYLPDSGIDLPAKPEDQPATSRM